MRYSWIAKVAAVALSVALVFGVSFAYAAGQVVTGSVNMNASFSEVTTAGITTNTLAQTIVSLQNYTNGTGSNQVDTIYAATTTLAGTPTTIDLTSLTDPGNNAVNFARVREFIIQNTDTTAGHDVKVEAASVNGWSVLPPTTNPIYCRYGSVIRISDPVSTGSSNGNVTGGTSKSVTFDPGANTITIKILIVGGSAA